MATEYDVVIIGAGAAGENVAGLTSPGGLSTVIIESELVGGECTFWACMPSKALLRPGEALAAAKAVPAVAGAVTGGIDPEAALRSMNTFAYDWNDYWQVKWVESVNPGEMFIRSMPINTNGKKRMSTNCTPRKRRPRGAIPSTRLSASAAA